jgi:phycobilisome rod-core linker protein
VSIPLLSYTPSSQNQRVAGYEVGSDEQPKIYSTDDLLAGGEITDLIWAAYRQIFSEHQNIKANRQTFLESQLKSGQISVRDFVRGLVLSDSFRRLNFETNNNYRFVEICVQRVLGRDCYNEREKIAWSIVVVNRGIQGFIDDLVNSEEYLSNFGDTIVPFQRRRILPQRSAGETPFNLKNPRYEAYHRSQLGFPQIVWQNAVRRFVPQEKQDTAGNPSLYLDMARAIAPKITPTTSVPLANINIETAVPYRKK